MIGACSLWIALAAAVVSNDGPATRQELIENPALIAPGTNVNLEGAIVRAASGNMLRVSVGRLELFVAPIDPSSIDFIRTGAVVDVRGTLRASPSAKQGMTTYAMNRRLAKQLESDGVYVDAWAVQLRR